MAPVARALFGRSASRLVVRIYVYGLVQCLLVAAALITVLAMVRRPPFRFDDTLAFATASIADTGGDRTAVAKVAERLQSILGCSVAVYDNRGQLVARDPLTAAPAQFSELPPIAGDLIRDVAMPGGTTWHLAFLRAAPRTAPPFIWPLVVVAVIVVGLSSIVIARWLARPLQRLEAAARDFGAGKLDARVRMVRSDEFGQLATAFDDMADHVVRALRVEKELLANISHELRTPLQRIHIAVDLAVEGNGDTARESLTEILEDVAELDRIVEDVLSATRLSLSDGSAQVTGTAAPPVRPEPTDLGALLEKSAARFRAARPLRALRADIAGDLPILMADGALLRRVIDNLLDNADKYSDDPGAEIALTARASDGCVAIEVRDDGPGIAAHDLARVFEPFFRAEQSRARGIGGLGLGLALARRIVEAHAGTLTLQSTLAVGTRARVELPVPGRVVEPRAHL